MVIGAGFRDLPTPDEIGVAMRKGLWVLILFETDHSRKGLPLL